MPLYKIQLKQGSRTIVEHQEFKTLQHLLDFYNTLTTLKVSEVSRIEYKDASLPPVDDMLYYPYIKAFIRNDESSKQVQITVRNIKLTKDKHDIISKIQQCMDIDTYNVDSIVSLLIQSQKS